MSERTRRELDTGLRRGALVVLCLLALGAGIAWYQGQPVRSPFPIVDSGVWVQGSRQPTIYWLDGDSLLFLGTVDGKQPQGPYPNGRALVRWDLDGAFTVVKPNVVGLCHRRGVSWMVEVREGERVHWRGRHDDERIVAPGEYFDPINCRYLEERPGASLGTAHIALLEEHGHLDLGPDFRSHDVNGRVHLRRPGAHPPVELPFGRWEIGYPAYYEFKAAYFMEGRFWDAGTGTLKYNWPRDVSYRVWWMRPDGTVTFEDLPLGPWNRRGGSVSITPTRTGYFVEYLGGSEGIKSAGAQGAYFIGQQRVAKILDGYVASGAVSPDGCKVALSHARTQFHYRPGPEGERTLKVVKLCG